MCFIERIVLGFSLLHFLILHISVNDRYKNNFFQQDNFLK